MSQSSMTADELRKKISDWISDKSNHENDLIDFLIDDCGCELRWSGEEEEDDVCDDCEGKCRSDETSSCEECGIELRNGCANNPSDHSIFDGCCDDCRECEEEEEGEYDCGCPSNTHNSVILTNEHIGEEVYVCPDCETDFVENKGFYNEHTGYGKKEHDAKSSCFDCGKKYTASREIDEKNYCLKCASKHEKPIEIIEECAICDKRLGIYDGNYEMTVIIDSIADDFEPYNCCGACALDRVKQKNFELVRKQPKKKYTFKKKSPK